MGRIIFLARLIGIALLVAACAGAQTPDSERILDAHPEAALCWATEGNWNFASDVCTCKIAGEEYDPAEGCRVPPVNPVCGDGGAIVPPWVCNGSNLGSETCQTQGFDGGLLSCSADCLSFDTSACTTDPPPPPPPGDLENGVWVSIPGSEMRSIYDPAIDDQWDSVGAPMSFEAIQQAWSGATCVGDELMLMGGGHADGAHNGVMAVNVLTGAWRRVTMPSPVWASEDCPGGLCTPPVGPTCTFNSCQVGPDGAPVARHTYDQITSDGTSIYVLGGSIWKSGSTGPQPRSWRLDLATATWTNLPDADTRLSGAAVSVGDEIFYAAKDFRARKYNTTSQTWQQQNLSEAVKDDTQIIYAPTNDRLYLMGDAVAWSVPRLDWPNVNVVNYSIPPTSIVQTDDVGALYYPPEELILFWAGGQTVETFDPATETWGSMTLGGENPGVVYGSGGPYGRWSYCGGRVVLVNGPDEPLYFIDVPQQSASNFEQLCAEPGVVLCDPLDTEGPYDGGGNVLFNPDGSEGVPSSDWQDKWRGKSAPVVDTSVKSSGTGSLRFTFPSMSDAGAAGNFMTNFSPDYSVEFGEGDTFHVRYKWRANCDALYFDCDPASPNYKTARRFFASDGGGNPTSFKLSIVGQGQDNSSCTPLEMVLVHGPDHYLTGYHHCGLFVGFEESLGLGNQQYQPGGQYDCQFNLPPDNRQRTWGDTGPDCFHLEADEWMTFEYGIAIGTFDQPNSHITVWASREGEPLATLVDRDFTIKSPQAGKLYGAVWLTPFMTAKDETEVHPTATFHYDELIVSTEFIDG